MWHEYQTHALSVKFQTISEAKISIKAQPLKFQGTNDIGVYLHHDTNPNGEDCAILIQTFQGRIYSARMVILLSDQDKR